MSKIPKMPKIPEMCGTCIHRKWVDDLLDYACMNPKPELHGRTVDFNDYCGEWEERGNV